MKILAIEKDIKNVNWEMESQILRDEAKAVYELMLGDSLREIYFTEEKHAILILECENKTSARALLRKLPLATIGLIDFEIIELHPYTGLSRLMNH